MEKVIDYTVPYYDMVGFTFLIRKVKQSTDIWKFINVIEPEVWYCILGAYFLSSLLLWVFDRYIILDNSNINHSFYEIRWSPYSYQKNIYKYEVRRIKFVFIQIRLTFFYPRMMKRREFSI